MPRDSRQRRRLVTLVLALLAGALMAAGPPDMTADGPPVAERKAYVHQHRPAEAGHPLRVIAYAAHPVGVILDTLIFRPADWIVHWEPLRTLFGHDDR